MAAESTHGRQHLPAFPLRIFIWWGPELVMLYNDAYRQTLQSKHPWALGKPGHVVWPEIWHCHRAHARARDADRRGDFVRRPAALHRAARLSRGDLPHLLLQPDPRRGGRGRWRLHRGHANHRESHRRAAAAYLARPCCAERRRRQRVRGLEERRRRASRESLRRAVCRALSLDAERNWPKPSPLPALRATSLSCLRDSASRSRGSTDGCVPYDK